MDLTSGISYKELDDSTGYDLMRKFYFTAKEMGDTRNTYFKAYWENWDLSKSTFLKFRINRSQCLIDIYRNDGFGGPYIIDKALKLNMDTKSLIDLSSVKNK